METNVKDAVSIHRSDQQPSVSKKQLKREKKRALFLEKRKEKRISEKLRKKARRSEARTDGAVLPRVRPRLMADSHCHQRIVIDMAFEHLMSDRDIRRTLIQLSHCYAVNRRVENPVQISFVHFKGYLYQIFKSFKGTENWDVKIEERPLCEVFDKERIIYLSADSDVVLEELDSTKVYAIGGLIDHNSHKNYCLRYANELGMKHARLPIQEFMKLRARKVLTINQVFEILLQFTQNQTWEQSFHSVIPKRKWKAKEVVEKIETEQGTAILFE